MPEAGSTMPLLSIKCREYAEIGGDHPRSEEEKERPFGQGTLLIFF